MGGNYTHPFIKKIKNMEALAAAIITLITTVVSTVVKVATGAAKTAKEKAALLNNRLAYMYATK